MSGWQEKSDYIFAAGVGRKGDHFPEKSIISIQYSDTLSQLLIDSEYKILTYIDSAGCTDCKLKLFLWNKLIHAVDSLNGMNVSFIFYSNMRNKDELERLIRRDNLHIQYSWMYRISFIN